MQGARDTDWYLSWASRPNIPPWLTAHLFGEPTRAQGLIQDLLAPRPGETDSKFKSDEFRVQVERSLASSEPECLAAHFVTTSFLSSALGVLLDHHWLLTRDRPEYQSDFHDLVDAALQGELFPISFLRTRLERARRNDLKTDLRKAEIALEIAVGLAKENLVMVTYSAFLRQSVQGMAALVELEKLLRSRMEVAVRAHRSRLELQDTPALADSDDESWILTRPLPSETVIVAPLYRAFDELDKALGLAYERDIGMRVEPAQSERLYEGAGLGVQSSYATILEAIRALDLKPNSRFIDLGSGYGRVGLIVGLLRPDIEFIGYEYVGHRVEAAQLSASRAGLEEHVRFFEQDLSRPEFKIPDADVYYLYDPFTRETYQHVFEQLKSIGRRQSIRVVTKGRASDWFQESVAHQGWRYSSDHDNATLGIFYSPMDAISD